MRDVRILEKRRLFEDVFAIDQAVLEFRKHDGSWSPPVRQLCFERGDSVAALIVRRDTNDLVLVSQFRYSTYEKGPGWMVEIVAGGLDGGESPQAAIVREIREETGYAATDVEPITSFYVSPGGTSERVHLFYAEVSGTPAPEGGSFGTGGDEDIALVELSSEKLWEEFTAGRLLDGKTIIALLWYRLFKDKGVFPQSRAGR
jgi:ADP-ribose pyrophosphatase